MVKALVLGFGVSGIAAARLLRAQGVEVIAVDRNPQKGVLPESPPPSLDGIDLLVVSPGIPASHPIVQQAAALGIARVGEIDLAFRALRNVAVGVTGSNGKTTAVSLIVHALNRSGRRARALGNIGAPLSEYALAADPGEILVVELSSFQLESLQQRCLDLALVLNITPNHLDRHASFAEYAAAKLHIRECLKETGRCLVSAEVAERFGLHEERFGGSYETLEAAHAVCRHLGLTEEEWKAALDSFQKPPHRMEFVAEKGGIAFYNDSKATSVDAVLYAMSSLEGPLILLAGGTHKGSSYAPWIEAFRGKVKSVIAFGPAGVLIEEELRGKIPCVHFLRLDEAFAAAVKQGIRGDRILLSPGGASFDQFRNYEERGEKYREMVYKCMI